jgi:hypothetical protein
MLRSGLCREVQLGRAYTVHFITILAALSPWGTGQSRHFSTEWVLPIADGHIRRGEAEGMSAGRRSNDGPIDNLSP